MKLRLAWVPFVLSAACSVEQDFGFPSSQPAATVPDPSGATPPVGDNPGASPVDDGTLAEWHWLNPPRGPSALRGIASSGVDNTWLAGDVGTVLHWDGAQMSTVRHGSDDETLYAVWASGPRDVWIGGTRGSAGLLLHYDGTTFAPSDLGGALPVSLWGAAANDVWGIVAGPSGATDIIHWDGRSWSAPTPLVGVSGPVRLRDIYGRDASTVFAVGDDGVVLRLRTSPAGGPAFTREASDATSHPFDAGLHYFAIWGPSSDAYQGHLWAVFVAEDGFGVSVIDTGTEPSVPAWRVLQRGLHQYEAWTSVHVGEADACAQAVIAGLGKGPRQRGHLLVGSAAGDFGVLSTALLDGTPAACGEGKFEVWTLGYHDALPKDVNAIGGIWPAYANGVDSLPDSSTFGLAFDGRQILAAGGAGAFLQTTGAPPVLQPTEPGVLDAPLGSVAAVSADEAWGASSVVRSLSHAPLLHFRYGFWGTVPGIRGDVTTVSFAGGTVWAAGHTARTEPNGMSGQAGFIVQGDGETFQQRIVNDCDFLTSIVGVGPDEAWAVGLGAPYDWAAPGLCIVHVTPSGAVRVPTPDGFVATLVNLPSGAEDWERYIDTAVVAAAGPKEVYIFAKGAMMGYRATNRQRINAVLRWDGVAFQQILDRPDLIETNFYDPPPLVARGPNDLLLGAFSMLHYDGARWSPLSEPGLLMPTSVVSLDSRRTLGIFGLSAGTEVRTLEASTWTPGLRSPVGLKAISRAADGSVWMVGEGGATARARRAAPPRTR
jgi:hypothetical protein